MDMPSFQQVIYPMRLFGGSDCLGKLGRDLDRLGSSKAVIFCGSSLAQQGSQIDLIKSAMGERCAGVFAGVRAHSPVPAVQAAAEELERLNADAVVAVGGGSAVVTARAASILVAEGGDPRALYTTQDEQGNLRSPRLLAEKLPQIIVPTTPNTAISKAGSGIFDPTDGSRLALFDPKTRAQSVFIHPDLIQSAPKELVVTTALDTLSLVVEGLTTRSGNAISDAVLMHATRLLVRYLANPGLSDDLTARSELVLAGVMGGQGTDQTGAGLATALSHVIGGRVAAGNGLIRMILLPHALRFNGERAEPGLMKVAQALDAPSADGRTSAETAIVAIEELLDSLGLPRRLRDVDLPRETLPELAARGMKDWFLRGNPRPVKEASELQLVLDQAW